MKKLRILSLPYISWVCMFTVVPLLIVIFFAITTPSGEFTILNISNVGRYFSVIVKSILLASIATFISLIIAYPFSYIISRIGGKTGKIAMMIVMLPMWMNFLLRTYAWMTILEKNGLLNKLLVYLNFSPVNIINTKIAVVIGMIYNYLPFMVLPLVSVMKKIEPSVIEAAQDLGSSGFSIFTKIIIPLTMPGVVSGVTMVFVPAVSTFIISRMLGGGGNLLIGDLIDMQFLGNSYNPHLGAAISLVLMVLILLCMSVMNQFECEDMEGKLV